MGHESARAPRVATMLALLLWWTTTVAAQGTSPEELRREVEAMKQQLRQMQEQIRKQEALIEKLSAEQGRQQPAAAAAPAPPVAPPPPTAADQDRLKQDVTAQVMRNIQPTLASAAKTFPSQFNPAIGLVIDTVGSWGEREQANFDFRSAEIGLSASIDPFARGYAILNGGQDGFEVEEAAIVTTSLPWNLTVKGGRFFADFGRLSKFHDHDLPFVNRPVALDRFVDGESQADGLEASWLAPLPKYVTLTAGAYNKIGAENDRVSNTEPRSFSQFTYLGRASTFLDLTDAANVELGTTAGVTPRVAADGGGVRNLTGVDLTFRWAPLEQAAYRGLVWGTEYLNNQEDRPPTGGPDENLELRFARTFGPRAPLPLAALAGPAIAPVSSSGPTDVRRVDANSLYSYLEAKLSHRLYLGFLFDWAQDLDRGQGGYFGYSPYATFWASEFQRFRLQYTHLDQPGDHDNQVFLQWTVILGSHVHGFRDR